MAGKILIYCPAYGPGMERFELEELLAYFLESAARDCGSGNFINGFSLEFEFTGGENLQAWADLLKEFLENSDVRPGIHFDVLPDGWQPGQPWRRVEIYGTDQFYQ